MSPRKTRRGKAKLDNVTIADESVSLIDDSLRQPETPPVHSRSLRTRKTKEPPASTTKTPRKVLQEVVEETPQPVRKTRTRRTQLETSVVQNDTLSSPANVRKRGRKTKNETIDKLSDEEKTAEVPEPAVKKTRIRKKSTSKIVNETLPNDSINKNQYDEEDIEVAVTTKSVAKKSPMNQRFQELKRTPRDDVTPVSSPIVVTLTPHRSTKTPRKSPINLNSPKTHSLSPTRHSKTPRKLAAIAGPSPVPFEIPTSATPTHESTSHKSPISLSSGKKPQRTPSRTPKIVLGKSKSKSPPSVRSSKVKRTPKGSPSPKKTTTPKKSVTPKNKVTPQKSAEKLATPKETVTSKKSVSPKKAASPQKTPKSAEKKKSVSPQKSAKKSPVVAKKSPKSGKTPPKSAKKIASPQKSPKLTKKSPGSVKKSPVVAKKSPKTTNKSPKSPKKSSNSPKTSSESPEKMKSEINENINSPQLILERVQSPASVDVKAVEPTPARQLHLTSRLHSLAKTEFRSSTPRDRAQIIRRSLNLSGGESPLNVSKFYGSPKPTKRSALLEDESNPLISDDDSFNLSGVKLADEENRTRSLHKNSTYELAEPKTPNLRQKKATTKKENDSAKKENDTYELDEPKTPGLRSRATKRSLTEMADGDTEEKVTKRVCRVRFASPGVTTPKKSSPQQTVRSRSATPSSKLALKNKTPEVNSNRRRSNSMSNLSAKSPGSALKRGTPSMGDVSAGKWNLKMMNESMQRLSRPRLSSTLTDTDKKKKIDVKTSSAKKVPNFAQIHQKKFEKMESLVENKKRLEERHTALTSSNYSNVKAGNDILDSSSITIRKPASDKAVKSLNFGTAEAKNGFTKFGFKLGSAKPSTAPEEKKADGYNRFGFKLRKQEATKIITRPTSAKLEEKKEQKRTALKGVRTNKRFELLMKSRNIQ